jgi:hypothetical protein
MIYDSSTFLVNLQRQKNNAKTINTYRNDSYEVAYTRFITIDFHHTGWICPELLPKFGIPTP